VCQLRTATWEIKESPEVSGGTELEYGGEFDSSGILVLDIFPRAHYVYAKMEEQFDIRVGL
jgi:hypothetical protein